MAEAISYTNSSENPRRDTDEQLSNGEAIGQIFPFTWDADSANRKLFGVIQPFQAAGERVEAVIQTRRSRVGPCAFHEIDLRGGGLLIYEPIYSMRDGLSQWHSEGFFDVSDVPPPACWVAYMIDQKAWPKMWPIQDEVV